MQTIQLNSIRFYKDSKVRGVWDDEQNKWFFSVLDIIGAINEQQYLIRPHDLLKNYNYLYNENTSRH